MSTKNLYTTIFFSASDIMEQHVITEVKNQLGIITLDRALALNSLSLAMVRDITRTLLTWRDDANITAVVMRSSSEKAFCAGGDIRFFYQKGSANAMQGGALIEDFFTEEYALNHLVHHYPKPYIAFMDGIVMGGSGAGGSGMGAMPPPASGSVPGRVTGNRPAPSAPSAPADTEGGPPDDDDVPF